MIEVAASATTVEQRELEVSQHGEEAAESEGKAGAEAGAEPTG
jgi:hypothetical protein